MDIECKQCHKIKKKFSKGLCQACYSNNRYHAILASDKGDEYRKKLNKAAVIYRKRPYVREKRKDIDSSPKTKAYKKNYYYRKKQEGYFQSKQYKERRIELSKTEKAKNRSKRYYTSNKGKQISRLYYINNREKRNAWHNEYRKNKAKNNPIFKLSQNIRNRIRHSIKKNGFKKSNTIDILGCSFDSFKKHLEGKFYNNPLNKEAMTWDNYGYGVNKWNIDHIVPLATAKEENDIVKLNHYTNLQPMWQWQNMEKGDNINYIPIKTLASK